MALQELKSLTVFVRELVAKRTVFVRELGAKRIIIVTNYFNKKQFQHLLGNGGGGGGGGG